MSDSTQSGRFLDHLGIPLPVTGIWYLLPVAITFAVLGLVPLRTWDYWWHATLGHLINTHGAIPAKQLFLYTAGDTTVPPQPWLGQLLLGVGQAAAGVYPALILRNIIAAAGVWWMTRVATRRTGDVRRGALVVLTALPFVVCGVHAGPMLFGWALFGLSIALGYHLRRSASAWWGIGFPCITVAWANLAPGFPLALCILLLFGADSLIRQGRQRIGLWGLTLLGSIAAAGATPYGLEMYPRYLDALPSLVTIDPIEFGSFSTFWLVITLVVSGWILATRRDGVEPIEGLLVAVFAPVALLFSNTLAFWAVVWMLIATRGFPSLQTRQATAVRRSRASQVATTLGGILLLIVPPLVQPVLAWRTEWAAESPRLEVRSRPPMKGVVPADTPWAAVEILEQRAVLPRLFHARKYSGFLAYFLLREQPRRILFTAPARILGDDAQSSAYRLAGQRPNVWRGLVHQYDIGAAVLETSSQRPLVERLGASNEWWTIVNKDGFAFFLERESPDRPSE